MILSAELLLVFSFISVLFIYVYEQSYAEILYIFMFVMYGNYPGKILLFYFYLFFNTLNTDFAVSLL